MARALLQMQRRSRYYEPHMPTTVRQISPSSSSALVPSEYGVKALAIMTDPNLVAVAAVSVIGLLVAIGFAGLLPLPDDLAALR